MSDIENILKDKNIRPTAMRMLVYHILSDSDAAMTLTDMENQLQQVDRTTLYRTIKTFENQGVVHAVESGTGVIKYALCEPFCKARHHKDLHLHFHCSICEETTCLTDYEIPQISLPKGYSAKDVHFTISGICYKCNRKS